MEIDPSRQEQLPLFDNRPYLIRRYVNVIPINDDGFDDVLSAPIQDSFEAAIIHFPTKEQLPDDAA